MATIALTSTRNSKIELGDFSLITSLVAIGNLAAQLAQLQGATDIDDHWVEFIQQCSINDSINSRKENLNEKIQEISKGELIDIYIYGTGSSQLSDEFPITIPNFTLQLFGWTSNLTLNWAMCPSTVTLAIMSILPSFRIAFLFK